MLIDAGLQGDVDKMGIYSSSLCTYIYVYMYKCVHILVYATICVSDGTTFNENLFFTEIYNYTYICT